MGHKGTPAAVPRHCCAFLRELVDPATAAPSLPRADTMKGEEMLQKPR